jgi:hypothetical protein
VLDALEGGPGEIWQGRPDEVTDEGRGLGKPAEHDRIGDARVDRGGDGVRVTATRTAG